MNSACQTAPKKFSEVQAGDWRGKALIKDKKLNKSQIVNMRVQAEHAQRLRLDVTSTIGTHVASFLLIGDNLEYIVAGDKTYYKTLARRGALNSVLNLPLDPRVLYNVFFDRPLEDKSWTCESGDEGFLKSCRTARDRLTIDWIYRKGEARTIAIDHPSATIQLNLYSYSAQIGSSEQAFMLKVPAAFKTVKLQ